MRDSDFEISEIIVMLLLGMFAGHIFTVGYFTSRINTQNGTFVLNGTEEWHYLQCMDYSKKLTNEFYDL